MAAQAEPAVEAAPEQERVLHAFVTESFKPDNINVVVPEPGQAGNLYFQAFIGQAGPDTYLLAKQIEIDADAAIAIGEYLVQEGRRIKTGLVTGAAILGADGRAVELRG